MATVVLTIRRKVGARRKQVLWEQEIGEIDETHPSELRLCTRFSAVIRATASAYAENPRGVSYRFTIVSSPTCRVTRPIPFSRLPR